MLTVGMLESICKFENDRYDHDRPVRIAKVDDEGNVLSSVGLVGRSITDDDGVLYLIPEKDESKASIILCKDVKRGLIRKEGEADRTVGEVFNAIPNDKKDYAYALIGTCLTHGLDKKLLNNPLFTEEENLVINELMLQADKQFRADREELIDYLKQR